MQFEITSHSPWLIAATLALGIPTQLYSIICFYDELIGRRRFPTMRQALNFGRHRQRVIITWLILSMTISTVIILAKGQSLPAFERLQDMTEHKNECVRRYEQNRCETDLRPKLERECFALVSAMSRPLYDVWFVAYWLAVLDLLTAYWFAIPQLSLVISIVLLRNKTSW